MPALTSSNLEPSTPNTHTPIAVCTLWEKDFHKGTGALVNSLVRAGFRGKVWAGYRGDLPPWAAGAESVAPDIHRLPAGPDVELFFVRLETTAHFTQYKPTWMLDILTRLDPDAAGIYYFDPDVMILGPWSFFQQWIEYGVAAVEDGSYILNPTHPLVYGWQAYVASLGYDRWDFVGAQINGGLVGIHRRHVRLLELWQVLMEIVRRDYKLGEVLKSASRTELFYASDQDVLTVACSIADVPVSLVGPDGMAFGGGEWLTIHAYSPKPWRRRLFHDLLVEGHKPDSALRLYWSLVAEPLAVEPAVRIKRHQRWIPLVALLSRFYKRGA
jgi:hypothetical protein